MPVVVQTLGSSSGDGNASPVINMSLDAYVRCTCIRDGKAKKPHPFPERFIWDESGAPFAQR